MIENVLQAIHCPLCHLPLALEGNSIRCEKGHCFDRAKQGYYNLLPVQKKKSLSPGDSKAMIQARKAHLNAGYYLPIAEKLFSILEHEKLSLHTILDAGCGEGYYLDYLTSRWVGGVNSIGVDISKEAVLAAAKRSKEIAWLVGTNVDLPVRNDSLDLILCLFGFPAYDHFKEKVKKGGWVLYVDPGVNHLIELREVLYPEVKQSQAPAHQEMFALDAVLQEQQSLSYQIHLPSQEAIHNLLVMTPHMYKAPHDGKKAAEALQSIDLTVDVELKLFKFN